ncbi:MAG: peptidylprolyl isomerase [Ruminococcus sp.]|nr:peptidylprolyl isomerase [Ruminococcus sp.]
MSYRINKRLLCRLAAAAVGGITAAAMLSSCGKTLDLDGSSDTSEPESAVSTETQDVSVMNFTAPEKGDQVIEIVFKDWGTVRFRLFPEYADKGVENFVGLANNGYYDGLTFHRIIEDFMIQGGDPLGTGTGGESVWNGSFDGGTDPHLIHAAGAVAYANSGSTATNGSQFYIVTGTVYDPDELEQYNVSYGLGLSDEAKEIYTTVGGTPWLDGGYTVFGQVYDGLDVIFNIQHTATDSSDRPLDSVIMESVRVKEYGGEELRWYLSDYDYTEPTEAPPENVPVANFTAPETDEKIIALDIRDYGTVRIKLFPEYAPDGVENFIGLAEQGYYDGLTFHRIISDFMIQGGDPEGTGMGGESVWGGSFDGGTDAHLIHAAGALSYANSGSTSTNGSQFFIVTGNVYTSEQLDELASMGYNVSENAAEVYSTAGGAPWLDGGYTVFGQVFDGLDVVFRVQNAETDGNDKPLEDVVIDSVRVESYSGDGSDVKWYISDYPEAEADDTAENADGTAEPGSETEPETEPETEAETSPSLE